MAKAKIDLQLSSEQEAALLRLRSGDNVFLTGGAGSGKSHLIRALMAEESPKSMPILASTGAAAVLVGGRTFHSFFGLGIMDGGPQVTLDKATRDRRVMKRVSEVDGFILDEVSMISGSAFETAEKIAKVARGSSLPWGGMRVIAVGDFAQLPPVSKTGQRDWSFLSQAWQETEFQPCVLTHNHRVAQREYLDVLQEVRAGRVTGAVRSFLEQHRRAHDPTDKATRLFPRRDQSEDFNQTELDEIDSPAVVIDSIYLGEAKNTEKLMKQAPVPERLTLKKGARVMFVQNDPQRRWVNGTRGTVLEITPDRITVEKDRGREVAVDKAMFSLTDADGNIVASMINFPLVLAYATTIHKSQGATLDELWVDLAALWEPGHAYVALSRLRTSEGLRVLRWSDRSFVVDPRVIQFYQHLERV